MRRHHRAHIFLVYQVSNYAMPYRLLTDNDPQFRLKCFVALCSTLGDNNISTTEYHLQTKCQVERFNSTLMTRLRHYVFEDQTDEDTYLLPLTYAYNIQVDRSIRVSSLRWHLPNLALDQPPSYYDVLTSNG